MWGGVAVVTGITIAAPVGGVFGVCSIEVATALVWPQEERETTATPVWTAAPGWCCVDITAALARGTGGRSRLRPMCAARGDLPSRSITEAALHLRDETGRECDTLVPCRRNIRQHDSDDGAGGA